MKKLRATVLVLASAAVASAGQRDKKPSADRDFTLGLVQQEVRVGMAQAELASALGSPNVLTRDSQGREAWVYDKIASEARLKSAGVGGGAGAIGAPGASLILGLLGAHAEKAHVTTSQRTLTVVIRFDAEARVESFRFHASRF